MYVSYRISKELCIYFKSVYLKAILKTMKTFTSILALIILIITLTYACSEKSPPLKLVASYELKMNKDTINLTDKNGFKQGYWEVRDHINRKEHEPPLIIESGEYKNNMKQGVWHYYDSTGKINRSVKYLNDMPTKN